MPALGCGVTEKLSLPTISAGRHRFPPILTGPTGTKKIDGTLAAAVCPCISERATPSADVLTSPGCPGNKWPTGPTVLSGALPMRLRNRHTGNEPLPTPPRRTPPSPALRTYAAAVHTGFHVLCRTGGFNAARLRNMRRRCIRGPTHRCAQAGFRKIASTFPDSPAARRSNGGSWTYPECKISKCRTKALSGPDVETPGARMPRGSFATAAKDPRGHHSAMRGTCP